MRARSLLVTLSLLPLLSACFVIDKIRGDDDEEAAEDSGEAEAEQPAEVKDPSTETDVKPRSAPTGVDRFKQWTPRHAYLGAPTFAAQVISDSEIIVATLDAHIGVSKDAGKTWQWSQSAGLIAGFGLGYLLTTMGEKPVTTPSEAKAVRVRATVAAAIISVVVLVGGALALPRYEDPRPVVTEIADRHNELIERYDALESPAERIAVIEGELVPAFREAELALRDIGTVPADVRTSIDNRIIYFERQQKAYALEVEGLRNNDPVVLAEAEDLHAEAIAELE